MHEREIQALQRIDGVQLVRRGQVLDAYRPAQRVDVYGVPFGLDVACGLYRHQQLHMQQGLHGA